MKKIFLSLVVLFVIHLVSAQDTLKFKDGKYLIGKVLEVGSKTLTIKKQENLDGPSYIINKFEVKKIAYANGSVDNFEISTEGGNEVRNEPSPVEPKPTTGNNNTLTTTGVPGNTELKRPAEDFESGYGKNILSFLPLQITNYGLGFGVRYERMLDKKQYLGFCLPFVFSYHKDNDYNSGYYYDQYNNPQEIPSTRMFLIMPGLKFYPGTSAKVFRYAVGPSIIIGGGRKGYTQYVQGYYDDITGEYVSSYNKYSTKDKFVLGFMINNGMNFTISKKIYMGAEIGLGVNYNQLFYYENNNYYNDDSNDEILIQMSFQVGYRF